MQFKVPQNIDLADRIVGPLTLVQFLYVLTGGMIIYFLFSTIAPVNPSLFFILAFPITVFTLALAFLKIQDQPFPKFVVAFFVFLSRPKVRIWHKEGLDPALIVTPKKQQAEPKAQPKSIKKSELEKLIQVLDNGSATTPDQELVVQAARVKASEPAKTAKLINRKPTPSLDAVKRKEPHGA